MSRQQTVVIRVPSSFNEDIKQLIGFYRSTGKYTTDVAQSIEGFIRDTGCLGENINKMLRSDSVTGTAVVRVPVEILEFVNRAVIRHKSMTAIKKALLTISKDMITPFNRVSVEINTAADGQESSFEVTGGDDAVLFRIWV